MKKGSHTIWRLLINTLMLSNDMCKPSTTKDMIKNIMNDINRDDTHDLFIKNKIEQMELLLNTMTYTSKDMEDPLRIAINELCEKCLEYIKEDLEKQE